MGQCTSDQVDSWSGVSGSGYFRGHQRGQRSDYNLNLFQVLEAQME